MCEMLGVRSAEPVPVEQVLDYAILLDEYGLAGFSWGIAWRTESNLLKRYRAVEGIRRDPLAYAALKGVKSTDYLVHLRRPSAMTTIALQNAQPYMNPEGGTAFCHNGYFADHNKFRPDFLEVLEGQSDSEVGFHYCQKLINEGSSFEQALIHTQKNLGGRANIMTLSADGELLAFSMSDDNAVYAFEMDGLRMVSTALHSQDDFLFQTVFPRAEQVELIARGEVHVL